MTANEIDRFRRIEAIFDAVLECPSGPERDAFLRRQEATTDASLLAEARQLLEDHEAVTAAVPMPPETLPRFGPWQDVYKRQTEYGARRARTPPNFLPTSLFRCV